MNQSQLLASQINFDVFHKTGVHQKGVDLVSGRELVQLKKERKGKKRERGQNIQFRRGGKG